MDLSTLIPLPKCNTTFANVGSNYRAIALSSIIGVVLDNMILMKNIDVLCSNDLQLEFKPKHSTTLYKKLLTYISGMTRLYIWYCLVHLKSLIA
jgi:hypothetical protein